MDEQEIGPDIWWLKDIYGEEGYKQLEDYRTPGAQEFFAKIDERIFLPS